tara:strand:- start:457 stop:687 length:231 start_codon:yes stop_codon:yes gene_type:complete
MKISPITWLIITTLLLVAITVFAGLKFPFHWVFLLTVLGQGLLVFSVAKVLKDNYTTNKTFEDFYEDSPRGKKDSL